MNKKIILPVLLACSIAKPAFSEDVTNVAKIGGVAVTGYAVYRFFNWLSYKNSRTLSGQAQSDLENNRQHFGPAIDIINQYFSPTEQNVRNGHKTVKETALYAMAVYLEGSGFASCQTLLAQLDASLPAINKSKGALEKRRKRVMDGKETDDTFDRAYVDSLLVEMDVLHSKLMFLQKFAKEHKAYFVNMSLGKKLAERDYPREIYIVNAGQPDMQYQLVYCARTRYNNSDYPLCSFVKQARADIASLTKSTQNLPYNYAIAIGAARGLEAQLLRSIEMVEASNEYLQEKKDKKNDDLKRERLRIEKDKADSEARKARAEERKANAEENKAAAEWAKVISPPQPQPVIVIR
jgi:hypothetical protein